MTKGERETTITYDLEEKMVRIFSAIPRDISKLRRAGLTPTYGSDKRGYGYKVPMEKLTWRIRTRPSTRVGKINPGLALYHNRNKGKKGGSDAGLT